MEHAQERLRPFLNVAQAPRAMDAGTVTGAEEGARSNDAPPPRDWQRVASDTTRAGLFADISTLTTATAATTPTATTTTNTCSAATDTALDPAVANGASKLRQVFTSVGMDIVRQAAQTAKIMDPTAAATTTTAITTPTSTSTPTPTLTKKALFGGGGISPLITVPTTSAAEPTPSQGFSSDFLDEEDDDLLAHIQTTTTTTPLTPTTTTTNIAPRFVTFNPICVGCEPDCNCKPATVFVQPYLTTDNPTPYTPISPPASPESDRECGTQPILDETQGFFVTHPTSTPAYIPTPRDHVTATITTTTTTAAPTNNNILAYDPTHPALTTASYPTHPTHPITTARRPYGPDPVLTATALPRGATPPPRPAPQPRVYTSPNPSATLLELLKSNGESLPTVGGAPSPRRRETWRRDSDCQITKVEEEHFHVARRLDSSFGALKRRHEATEAGEGKRRKQGVFGKDKDYNKLQAPFQQRAMHIKQESRWDDDEYYHRV